MLKVIALLPKVPTPANKCCRTIAPAICLQTMVRMESGKTAQQQDAARQLQSAWRGTAVRLHLKRQSQAAVVLQAVWRGRRVRATIARQGQAALRIQAQWRAFAGRQDFLQQRKAVTKVGPLWMLPTCRYIIPESTRQHILLLWPQHAGPLQWSVSAHIFLDRKHLRSSCTDTAILQHVLFTLLSLHSPWSNCRVYLRLEHASQGAEHSVSNLASRHSILS